LPGRTFVLIVFDRDTGEFSVEGPISDDRPWDKAVVNAQEVGRNTRCFAMGNMTPRPSGRALKAAPRWRGRL
jgi:hypothetical protein